MRITSDYYLGDYHGHREHTEGELTTGEYKVKLPDGRIQVVSYEADHHGFRPRITYEPAGHDGDHPVPPPLLEVIPTPPEVVGAPPHLHHPDHPPHPPPHGVPPMPQHYHPPSAPHHEPEYRLVSIKSFV